MVFYFVSAVVDPPLTIYMGRDKYENEDLIKYGWDEDVWFHVDKLSSAHVYMRLPKGTAWDAIPQAALEDCAQLVKENSIEGCKKPSVVVIYTPWSNLKKTGEMDTGQVAFHNNRLVRSILVEKRNTEVLSRLRKTKEERNPDLMAERQARDQEEVRERRKLQKERLAEEKRVEEERRRLAEERSYDRVFAGAEMTPNRGRAPPEDDFM